MALPQAAGWPQCQKHPMAERSSIASRPGGRSQGRSALGARTPASEAVCMYIRHDVHVNQPAHSVRRELFEPPERWLPASIAEPIGGRRYLARVGFSAPAARISKQVELTL